MERDHRLDYPSLTGVLCRRRDINQLRAARSYLIRRLREDSRMRMARTVARRDVPIAFGEPFETDEPQLLSENVKPRYQLETIFLDVAYPLWKSTIFSRKDGEKWTDHASVVRHGSFSGMQMPSDHGFGLLDLFSLPLELGNKLADVNSAGRASERFAATWPLGDFIEGGIGPAESYLVDRDSELPWLSLSVVGFIGQAELARLEFVDIAVIQ